MRKKIYFPHQQVILSFLFAIYFLLSGFCLSAENIRVSIDEINRSSSANKEVKNVFCQAFEDNYKPFPPQTLRNTFNDFEDVKKFISETFDEELTTFKSNNTIHLITAKNMQEGDIVGIVIFQFVESQEGQTVHIKQMAVLPAYQRKNIGTTLLSYIMQHNPGIVNITADTRAINTKAIQFYAKQGFFIRGKPNDKELDPSKYRGLCMSIKPS